MTGALINLQEIYGTDGKGPSPHARNCGDELFNQVNHLLRSKFPTRLDSFPVVFDNNHARMFVGDTVILRWSNLTQFWIGQMVDGREMLVHEHISTYPLTIRYLEELLRRELAGGS